MATSEAEWLSAKTISELEVWRHGSLKPRKLRLYGVACCRRAVAAAADSRYATFLERAESFADGQITWDDLKRVRATLGRLRKEIGEDDFGPNEPLKHIGIGIEKATKQKPEAFVDGAVRLAFAVEGRPDHVRMNQLLRMEERQQLVLARDIFGNPFRPIAFDPVWRTADTLGIAARMYESRDFAAMPILADALEEAGCTNPDVLLHCREPGVHVRGCWIVDLALGKC